MGKASAGGVVPRGKMVWANWGPGSVMIFLAGSVMFATWLAGMRGCASSVKPLGTPGRPAVGWMVAGGRGTGFGAGAGVLFAVESSATGGTTSKSSGLVLAGWGVRICRGVVGSV